MRFKTHNCNIATAAAAAAAHCNALKIGYLGNLYFATRILVAYSKCGFINDACKVFDEIPVTANHRLDVICWNSIISGCVQNTRDQEAFRYFKQMQSYYRSYLFLDNGEDYGPDSYTLSSILSSTYCMEIHISPGEQLHGLSCKTGVSLDLSVGNSLITLYARWGRVQESWLVFESMSRRNVVSWTALISGFARQSNYAEESLKIFILMMREKDQRPNNFTFASIFGSCGRLASLCQGTLFVTAALKMGYFSDILVKNSLVGFYSECGWLEEAIATFDSITDPDLVSWNSLLKGYSQQGRGKEALQAFAEMQARGQTPDAITFLSIISACRHTGMVDEGLKLFRSMKLDHEIEPRNEHISCIVDLLGRAGQLQEAADFIKGIKIEVGPSVWRTLLGACRVHRQADELAELAAEKLLEFEPYDTEAHNVLCHIYATNRRWDMVANMRRSFKEKGVGKEPGFSWVEVGNRVYSFVAADWNHPLFSDIQTTLLGLTNHMNKQVELL